MPFLRRSVLVLSVRLSVTRFLLVTPFVRRWLFSPVSVIMRLSRWRNLLTFLRLNLIPKLRFIILTNRVVILLKVVGIIFTSRRRLKPRGNLLTFDRR